MAFPTVVNTATTNVTSTTLTLNMPASLVAGRALVAVTGYLSNDSASPPSGWTDKGSVGRTNRRLWVTSKIATGSDSWSVNFGVSVARAGIVYQIDDWEGVLADLVVALGSASLSALDPPNLAAPFADDWLWLGAVVNGAAVSSAPTNYTNYLEAVQSTLEIGTARRELNASSEDPGTFGGTASSPLSATIAIPPVETFGDITYVGNGAIAASATNPAVAYPTGIAADDLLIMVVGQKPATAGGGGVTTPAGWTLKGSLLDAGGYATTVGVDVGNTNLFVYQKDSVSGSESGSVTVTTSDNSVAWGWMHRLSCASGDWTVDVVTGEDTSAGNVSVAFGSDPGIEAEDYILGAMCIPTDVTTPAQFSAQALSASGVTFGTVREIGEPDSSLGNDIGGFMARSRVLSGTSSGAPTLTATAGGTTTNVRGPVAFIRIREGTGTPPPDDTSRFLPFFM